MKTFNEYLDTVENADHKVRLEELFQWISETFPDLESVIKWNQPIYTHHGTFIIGFSTAKKHLAVSPENSGITQFSKELEETGYHFTSQIFRIPWNKPVDYALLKKIIQFNIEDKANHPRFWR